MKVGVITGSRAEYGLLYWTMKEIEKCESLDLQLFVTGMHLSDKFGSTINDILEDGFVVTETIPIMSEMDEEKTGMAKGIGKGVIGFASAFEKHQPDMILLLGDRFEVFASAAAAMAMNIPIAHISGGEITEGAVDDQIRHAITKMAHIHFPGAQTYAENLMKLGEEPWRIHNVGDPGIEAIMKHECLGKAELEASLGLSLDKETVLVTYHPVTMELDQNTKYIRELLGALEKMNVNIIFTYPNMDDGGMLVIHEIEAFVKTHSNAKAFKSLGSLRYLSLLHYVGAMIGNSSSGIVEAPAFKLPVINVGNRQTGRLKATNIIDTPCVVEDILAAWRKIQTDEEYRDDLKSTISLYGSGNTSVEIVEVLRKTDINRDLMCKKIFGSE